MSISRVSDSERQSYADQIKKIKEDYAQNEINTRKRSDLAIKDIDKKANERISNVQDENTKKLSQIKENTTQNYVTYKNKVDNELQNVRTDNNRNLNRLNEQHREAISELSHAQNRQMDGIQKQKQEQLESAKDGYLAKLKKLEDEFTTSHVTDKHAINQNIEKLHRAYQKQIKDIETQKTDSLSSKEEEKIRQLNRIKQGFENDIAMLNQEKARTSLADDFNRKKLSDGLKGDYTEKIDALTQKQKDAVTELSKRFSEETDKIAFQHQSNLNRFVDNNQERYATRDLDNKYEIKRLETEKARDKQRHSDTMTEKIDSTVTAYEKQIAKNRELELKKHKEINDSHGRELSYQKDDLTRKWSGEKEELKENLFHEKEMKELLATRFKEQHADELEKLQAMTDQKLLEQKQNEQRMVEDLTRNYESQVTGMKDQHYRDLKKMQEERDRALQSQRTEYDKILKARTKEYNDKISEQTRRYDATMKDKDKTYSDKLRTTKLETERIRENEKRVHEMHMEDVKGQLEDQLKLAKNTYTEELTRLKDLNSNLVNKRS